MNGDDDDRLRPVGPDGRALPQVQQPGYYPGFSTLAQSAFWDDATRTMVHERVEEIPPLRFFSSDEALLLAAIVDRVLPQDDRARRAPHPDRALHRRTASRGAQRRVSLQDMPPDGEAHKLGLQAIDASAHAAYDRGFVELSVAQQEQVLKDLHDGRPGGGQEIWKRMPVHRFWVLLMHDVVDVYYAHPWAWDEIGFGGPAYPRGYMRLERGEPEPWEVDEQRYEWRPPRGRRIGSIRAVAGHATLRFAGTGRHTLKRANRRALSSRRPPGEHWLGPMQRLGRADAPLSTDRRRSTTASSAWARRAACCCSGWRAPAFASSASRPVRSGTPSATGSATRRARTSSTGTTCASPAANIRSPSARTTAARASAAARCTGPRSRRAFILRISASTREDGVGVDWPMRYEDLKPYYELLEQEMPVAGPAYFPWGDPHGYPYGPHPMGGVGDALIRGCTKLGIGVSPAARWRSSRARAATGRTASIAASASRAARSARSRRTLITHVPDAIEHGAEIRDHCMVGADRHRSRAAASPACTYFDRDGREQFQRARAVIVCGYAIETPRLLLNSACPGFENGLGQLQRHASGAT